MADLDLTALRVPMRPLRGAGDLLGLSVYHLSQRFPFAEWAVVVGDCTDGTLLLVNVHDAEAAIVHVVRPGEGDDLCVTTADASTRDRLARRVAERLYPNELHLAACVIPGRGGSAYVASLGLIWGILTVDVQEGARWRALLDKDGSPLVPHLDPQDPRRLPDGSRWVDAAALAAVAR